MAFVGRRFQTADLLLGRAHPFGKLLDVPIVPIMSPFSQNGVMSPLSPVNGRHNGMDLSASVFIRLNFRHDDFFRRYPDSLAIPPDSDRILPEFMPSLYEKISDVFCFFQQS